MGVPLKVLIDSLLKEFGGNEKQLYADWERRDKWIPQIVQLDDETLVHQLIRGAQDILAKVWLTAETSKNSFARLRALTLIKDTNLDLLKTLQSIGLIAQRPIQVDQRILVIKGRWWLPGAQADDRASEQHGQQPPGTHDIPLS
jgi:hypothetical protein